MKKSIVVFAGLLLLLLETGFAQSGSVTSNASAGAAKTLYGEIGGPGVLSINYDQRFKGEKGLGFRAGIGGISVVAGGFFTVPVALNYLIGSKSNYFELGAGISSITIYNGASFFDQNASALFGHISFGYRYQPEQKGFTGRIFISPIFVEKMFFPVYGGISAGIRLK